MCMVSVVTQYGRNYPDSHWNKTNWPPMREMIAQAEAFDKKLNEPECQDPEKDEWQKRIEERIQALEAAAFRSK